MGKTETPDPKKKKVKKIKKGHMGGAKAGSTNPNPPPGGGS